MTFISYKQGYDYSNSSYTICIYISIIFMLLDTVVCGLCDSTTFVVYNVVYLSCVLNCFMTYGNLLSIILFVFESTNVSIDWFCLNMLTDPSSTLNKTTMRIGLLIYICVNKIVITPTIIMSLYYGISGNITQPLFMISFSLYVTNILKIFELLRCDILKIGPSIAMFKKLTG